MPQQQHDYNIVVLVKGMNMSHLTSVEMSKIEERVLKIPEGGYTIHSVGVKNYLMWVGGDWPAEKDYDLCEFFAHAGTDIAHLLRDAKSYRLYNEDMKVLCDKQDEEIQRLKKELMTIKGE